MHYEITQDCRIGNTDYKAGQIVTKEEVGGLFFHVMKETDEAVEAPKGKKKVDPKTPSKETEAPDKGDEEKGDEEADEEADEKADEAVEAPKGKKK